MRQSRIAGLFFLFAGGTLVGCGSSSSARVQPAEQVPAPPVKAERPAVAGKANILDLFWKYTDNTIEADLLYAGKRLELTGKVDEIGKDAAGRYSLQFSGFVNKPPAIFCYLATESLADAANVRAGDSVTFTGRVSKGGKSGTEVRIEVEDCVLLKPN